MTTNNAGNERIKRQYFLYLKEAKRCGEFSLDAVAKALHRFESFNRFRDFRSFHISQAMAFKRHLATEISPRSGKALSKATVYSTLYALRHFFHWLAGRAGFRSRLSYADAEYFNLSENETRIAKAHREQRFPTLEQIFCVLNVVPRVSEVERRNRALVAFILITGARDSAVASIKLKHVDLKAGTLNQDAREVRTKFSKTFKTTFFPVGGEAREIVADWSHYLLREKLWGPDDPLFPASKIVVGPSKHFLCSGVDRRHWRNASPIRKIFREAFATAGLPYFNPHSIRKTLVQLGEKLCQTPEEFKAWSQNLGHERVLTTFCSYGEVSAERQVQIIRSVGSLAEESNSATDLIEQGLAALRRQRSAGTQAR